MKGYKSSISRLARLFKQSRDKWKKRAKERQKKVRALETQVRDLSQSRQQWKQKAKQAQRELEQLKAEGKTRSEQAEGEAVDNVAELELGDKPETDKVSRAVGHQYPLYVIHLALEQLLDSLNSLRGSQKTFELFSQYFPLPRPSYSSIRHWLLRVGLYELQQAARPGSDWIIMLDLTIELGPLKCLVILGLPARELAQTGYTLDHQDVQVLEVAVLSHCTGAVIEQSLVELSKRIGPPLQIISDHGSDLKKGISLYQQQHPEVIWTYDVSHQMALLLEKELAPDEPYQAFMRHCAQSRHQTKQTPLYFLASPKQRLKARYLNVEGHLHWAQQLLQYQAQGDFSAITPHFSLDKRALTTLQSQLDPVTLARLTQLSPKTYPDRHSFAAQLSQYLGPDRWGEYEPSLYQATDLGRRHFEEKFGWLSTYQADISQYAQMMDLVRRVEHQLKHSGLSPTSPADFANKTAALSLSPRLQRFRSNILTYLQIQAAHIPDQTTLLATSDVLESIFGKYKLFSTERSFKEMGQMVLTIPLLTAKMTPQRIKQALETVQTSDVQQWARQVFGQSMLSKRKTVFKSLKPTQKLLEKSV